MPIFKIELPAILHIRLAAKDEKTALAAVKNIFDQQEPFYETSLHPVIPRGNPDEIGIAKLMDAVPSGEGYVAAPKEED
jgi:hypothetical protein